MAKHWAQVEGTGHMDETVTDHAARPYDVKMPGSTKLDRGIKYGVCDRCGGLVSGRWIKGELVAVDPKTRKVVD